MEYFEKVKSIQGKGEKQKKRQKDFTFVTIIYRRFFSTPNLMTEYEIMSFEN